MCSSDLAAIRSERAGLPSTVETTRNPLVDGATCLAERSSCSGDNPDAAYMVTEPVPLGAGPGGEWVVAGVNHHATGKATYASVTPYDANRNRGARSVLDVDLAGSAARYLGPDTRAVEEIEAARASEEAKAA